MGIVEVVVVVLMAPMFGAAVAPLLGPVPPADGEERDEDDSGDMQRAGGGSHPAPHLRREPEQSHKEHSNQWNRTQARMEQSR